MLKTIRRAIQKRATRKVLDRARAQGLTPPEVFALAFQIESGIARFRGEPVYDYAARCAGVSREQFDRYRTVIERGERPPVEMLPLHLFMDRIDRRLVALTAGDSTEKGAPDAG